MKRRWFIAVGLLVAAFICRIVWIMALPSEPAYGGKRLSAWLDELSGLGSLHSRAQGTAQIQAVRAIGTNAIPWLIEDYRHRGTVWEWRLNQLLKKQKLVNYRLRDANDRPYRATVGFRALGEMAEPAIPELLALARHANLRFRKYLKEVSRTKQDFSELQVYYPALSLHPPTARFTAHLLR
jgi:hypothetical protein